MARRAVLTVVTLALGGCGFPCTEIGCANGVTFELGAAEVALLSESPAEVRGCVGSDCVEATVTPQDDGAFAADPAGLFVLNVSTRRLRMSTPALAAGTRDVSLTVRREGVERFARTWPSVAITTSRPNGPQCPPACTGASVGVASAP